MGPLWHAEEFWRPYFFYVGLSALYALFAAGIVAFWAPEAAGSGMSEIKVCCSARILAFDSGPYACTFWIIIPAHPLTSTQSCKLLWPSGLFMLCFAARCGGLKLAVGFMSLTASGMRCA